MNNSKNKIYKKILIVLLSFIILLLCQFFTNENVYASSKSKEEIGEYIAEFAVDFAKYHGEETIYSYNFSQRGEAYNGKKTSGHTDDWNGGVDYTDKYAVDCVGWVSMAIHQSTGLDNALVSSGNCGFVTPDADPCKYSSGYFEIVNDEPRVGDIVIRPETSSMGHVQIYIGNGKVIDSTIKNGSGVRERTIDPDYTKVARISDAGVAAINDSDLTTIFNGKGSITGNLGGGGFDYNGLTPAKFGLKTYDYNWLLNSLLDIVDWYIGFMTYSTRIILTGLTSFVEVLIDGTMKAVSGREASLTIEKLLFNKVPILDVNFFDFSSAGGEEIIRAEEGEQENVLYVIRENIAVWYTILRNLSIILLLITLIYLGIRMAISSVAEEKAKYKELLKSWFASFLIVFSIHYIMIFILYLNQALIDTIVPLRRRRVII